MIAVMTAILLAKRSPWPWAWCVACSTCCSWGLGTSNSSDMDFNLQGVNMFQSVTSVIAESAISIGAIGPKTAKIPSALRPLSLPVHSLAANDRQHFDTMRLFTTDLPFVSCDWQAPQRAVMNERFVEPPPGDCRYGTVRSGHPERLR